MDFKIGTDIFILDSKLNMFETFKQKIKDGAVVDSSSARLGILKLSQFPYTVKPVF